jgi:hypothetical protein
MIDVMELVGRLLAVIASEAKQSRSSRVTLDCFASLAMTRSTYGRVLAARFVPELFKNVTLIKTEGAGNAGRWPHPWPACEKNAGGRYHRFSRDIPAFPARWLERLLRVLPGAPGFLATVACATREAPSQA